MKGIEIAERLKPYSHSPGTCCFLPHTSFLLRIFPARLGVYDAGSATSRLVGEITGDIKGPVKDFTVSLDLEKENIFVWGCTQDGYYRYRIAALPEEKIGIFFEKKAGEWKSNTAIISLTEKKVIRSHDLTIKTRLSLGNHKAQDADAIRRRADMIEIFPLWHRLGMLVSSVAYHEEGTAALLKNCKEVIEQKYPEKILAEFHRLFLAGFEGILSPRLQDMEYQGLAIEAVKNNSSSPLILLQEGAKLIESLFITRGQALLEILPHLPLEFHSGRMIYLSIAPWGSIDLEWTKKLIRRVVLRAEHTGELVLKFQKPLKSFRLRILPSEKGIEVPCGSPISIEKGSTYLLDNFQK